MTGLLIGALFGAGLIVAIAAWRASAPPPPLVAALHRVPAYAPEPRADGPLAKAVQPLLDILARTFGGRAAVARKLQLAGDERDVEQYLLTQVMWAAGFAAAAMLLILLSGAATRPGVGLLLIGLAAVGGLLFGDYLLGRRVAKRREATAEQFPVAAQLLALLIAAGEQPSAAVGRVGAALGGPLGRQLQAVAKRTAAGCGFAASMREFAAATDLAVIDRFVAGLLSAVERGSPLSELMRAQALDAAADSHRALMAAAGRRDIAMLVPVVFAVLPTVVMVVLLPGAVQLGLIGS